MSLEPQSSSSARQRLGSLNGCLVEGDPDQRTRERRVRRRALLISVSLQGAVLAALILIPLLGRPERIALASVPLPPYYSGTGPPPAQDRPRPARAHQNLCRICPPIRISPIVATHDLVPPDEVVEGPIISGVGPEMPGPTPVDDSRPGVRVPRPVETQQEKPRVVHVPQVDPATLIHRVDPIYPTLARQIGRAGRVELRAVIAIDGTIESLCVVDGDPLFYQSALDAVRQWRYRPTILNGQPVEVDTYITVIYNMQR